MKKWFHWLIQYNLIIKNQNNFVQNYSLKLNADFTLHNVNAIENFKKYTGCKWYYIVLQSKL